MTPSAHLTGLLVLGLSLCASACGSDDPAGADGVSGDQNLTPTTYTAELTDTLLMGTADNAEVLDWVPGTDRAILISSKARKVSLLEVSEGQLTLVDEVTLFSEDSTESELTHVDVSSDGTWAAITRTILRTDEDGGQTACEGELVIIDVQAGDDFGTVLATVAVGAMPDSVTISDDDAWVATADERDGPDAWGKCEVAGAEASVSLVDLSQGAEAAQVAGTVLMVDGETGPREPEDLVFSSDGAQLIVTLQDSHEVAFIDTAALVAAGEQTTDDVTLVALPPNALGASPWPDGVARFADARGAEHYAIAGEWNDTLIVLDSAGAVVTNLSVALGDIPEAFPRVEDEGSPRFSPDSLSAFMHEGRAHLAVTLRHSGAVAIWDVSDAASPVFATAIQVGQSEAGGADEDGSTIRPEGVSTSPDGRFIITANEEESSVSLIEAL
jgi:DNA-binding beta-propeller fold protein YncE